MTQVDLVIRKCIIDSGESVYMISKKCGIKNNILYDFVRKKNGLYSKTLDKLIDYFGLELVKIKT